MPSTIPRWIRPFLLIGVMILVSLPAAARARGKEIAVTVTPAAAGSQMVRASLPFPGGMLRESQALVVSDGQRETATALRVLTWHPAGSVRRALVTFPYTFKSKAPVRFTLRPTPISRKTATPFPASVGVEGETVTITYAKGPTLKARWMAPARISPEPPRTETVESNAFFLWQRIRLPDPQWPRVIEIRSDAAGGVVLVAHLQRRLAGDGYAPDLGWEVEIPGAAGRLRRGKESIPVTSESQSHRFSKGRPCSLFFQDDRYRLYSPVAPLKRKGYIEVRREGSARIAYRYWRCRPDDKVPMQQAAWQRAEVVIAPAKLAPLTATLESPHEVKIDPKLWDALYDTGQPLSLQEYPELDALLRYHRDAVVKAMALGDDWGNVTDYADGRESGGAFGMNRLNHCPAIFEEGFRSGDRRLLEAGVLWCDNFYDQSVWWGPDRTGGTRYNNLLAMNQASPDNDRSYMWRSNSAVHFCTKGYDSFFFAYEQTGDPRMQEALEAQVAYASRDVHADRGECRNIGDVIDFTRLYRFTGEKRYLDEALRLFRELRSKLSAGDLFSQGGDPIVPDPPFIDDDDTGYRHPFAKPYIIGYALAGLPGLAGYFPGEPELRDVVQAVADFLAESQDPIGGWRYPHPRSSSVILSQAMEHAWQLAQADTLLGAQEKHLDAIERVLRQRILGWRKTGRIFNGLSGWEMATGKVKEQKELYNLYRKPSDRDFTRDYTEGQFGFGSSSPEGLVYFPEVLAFYLKHRPASRLLAPPESDEPLGKVLKRVPGGKP